LLDVHLAGSVHAQTVAVGHFVHPEGQGSNLVWGGLLMVSALVRCGFGRECGHSQK
jgi:hypothetical protein